MEKINVKNWNNFIRGNVDKSTSYFLVRNTETMAEKTAENTKWIVDVPWGQKQYFAVLTPYKKTRLKFRVLVVASWCFRAGAWNVKWILSMKNQINRKQFIHYQEKQS